MKKLIYIIMLMLFYSFAYAETLTQEQFNTIDTTKFNSFYNLSRMSSNKSYYIVYYNVMDFTVSNSLYEFKNVEVSYGFMKGYWSQCNSLFNRAFCIRTINAGFTYTILKENQRIRDKITRTQRKDLELTIKDFEGG